MPVVRMVKHDDAEALQLLADTVEGYMTTMPKKMEQIKKRIRCSIDSTDKRSEITGKESYLFVLEDDNHIVGVASLFAAVGSEKPFYNYRLTRSTAVSQDMGIRNDIEVLNLVNDYNGCTELATLYLHPDYRGGGRGKLLSYARLFYIRAHRNRFADRSIAEIRGWTDKNNLSPFWEAVGAKFFNTNMSEVDARSGAEFQFIADLMPKFPIYVNLLPDDAQQVIAKQHPSARAAANLLKNQGFRYQGLVDIFDAGMCVDAWTDQINLIQEAQLLTVQIDKQSTHPSTRKALIANPDQQNFRVIFADLTIEDHSNENAIAKLPPDKFDKLKLLKNQEVLVYLLPE